MNKEEFIKLIEDHQNWNKRIDAVSEVLGSSNLYEIDWIEYAARLFDTFIIEIFTEEGSDNIFWWLYEKEGRSDMKMWDKDGVEIPTETIDDLWNIVKTQMK